MTDELKGLSVTQIEAWLGEHTDDKSLALAFANVHNQTGELLHEVMEAPYDFAAMLLREWCGLEEKICLTIVDRLGDEAKNKPLLEAVRPFLEANGYREDGGNWKKPKD